MCICEMVMMKVSLLLKPTSLTHVSVFDSPLRKPQHVNLAQDSICVGMRRFVSRLCELVAFPFAEIESDFFTNNGLALRRALHLYIHTSMI